MAAICWVLSATGAAGPAELGDDVGEALKAADGREPTNDSVGAGGAIKAVEGVGTSGNVEPTALPERSSLRSRDSTARYARLDAEFFMIVFLK
jgi:hypothetical protein